MNNYPTIQSLEALTDSSVHRMLDLLLTKVKNLSATYVTYDNIVYDLIKRLIPRGKQLRSRIMLGVLLASGRSATEEDLWIAAIIESLHAASLLHDDVIDHSNERHNIPSANAFSNNRNAILSGDFLLILSMLTSLNLKKLGIEDILQVIQDLLGGEMFSYELEHSHQPSLESYERLIYLKTSSLFVMALKFGLLPEENRYLNQSLYKQFMDFGKMFGYLYQLQDDIRDYFFPDLLGKNKGQDFLEGKWTYPILCLWDTLNQEERNHWVKLKKAKDFTKALEFLNAYHSKDRSINHLHDKINVLKGNISTFPVSYHGFLNILLRDYIVLL